MEEKDVQQLIVRYLSNEATEQEVEELLDWVASDSKNFEFFNESVSSWSDRSQSARFDVNNALNRLNHRVDRFEDQHRERSLSWSWLAIAASLVFFMMVGAGLYFWNGSASSVALNKVSTSSKIDTLQLSDGSLIYLNKNSTLEYPQSFDGDSREVQLTGEAFFEVKRDPAKPFIIHTGNIRTQVLGTTFNVDASMGLVSVVVETGRVMVQSPESREVLNPTDKVIYNQQSESFKRSTADLDKELDWRYNTIIFDDAPLSEVAEILKKHFDVTFTFDNERNRDCLITGKFRDQSLDTILKAIEFSTNVQFDRQANRIRVIGDGCDKSTNLQHLPNQ